MTILASEKLKAELELQTGRFDSGLKSAGGSLDKFAGEVARARSGLDLANVAATTFAVGGVAALAGRLATGVAEFHRFGAGSLELSDAFDGLANQMGGNADEILGSISRASSGTISEMDMMASASRGMMLGLGADAETWGQLTEVARLRARAMGLDTTQALNDITTGIGRQSTLILDNLGILVDLETAYEDYAESIGKSSDSLSDSEKKQALLNQVIGEGQEMLEAQGPIVDNAADAWRELEAAWKDAKSAAAEAVAESGLLTKVLEAGAARLRGEDEYAKYLQGLEESGRTLNRIQQLVVDKHKEEAEAAKGVSPAMEAQEEAAESLSFALKAVAQAEDNLRQAQEQEMPQHWIDIYTQQLEMAKKAVLDARVATVEYADSLHLLSDSYKIAWDDAKKFKGEVTEITKAVWASEGRYNIAEPGLVSLDDLKNAQDDRAKAHERNLDYIAEKEQETADKAQAAWNASIAAQQSAWNSLRSTIKTALQGTSATSLDFEQTESGTYVDKWDEDARRLEAIAARGFAELQAHADWASVLKIPPEILSGSEQALKDWAANTAVDVRDLARPDLLQDNLEAMVQRVRDYMAREQAIELTVDMVAAELAGEGVSKEDVAAGLGVAPVQLPVSMVPVSPEGEPVPDLETAGASFASSVAMGMSSAMGDMDLSATFIAKLDEDIEASQDDLKDAGERVWKAVEPGIEKALKATPWTKIFARHLAPYVADVLINRGSIVT